MENDFTINQDKILSIIEEIISINDVKLEEMPEYKLYISQIEEFFEKKLGKNSGDDEDKKVISKTMIQNYIKDGLLMPPEGKYYNRNHVMLLALIYNLKPILAIKDIKKLLTPLLNHLNHDIDEEYVINIYDSYMDLKTEGLEEYNKYLFNSINNIKKYVDGKDNTTDEWNKLSMFLLVVSLTTQATIQKKLAEYVINNFFK